MYLNAKNERSIGQGFQTLEHYKRTHTQIRAVKRGCKKPIGFLGLRKKPLKTLKSPNFSFFLGFKNLKTSQI